MSNSSNTTSLTEEQLKRIEENRKRALALKEAKAKAAMGETHPNYASANTSNSSAARNVPQVQVQKPPVNQQPTTNMSNNKVNTIRSPQNVTSPPRQQQQQQQQRQQVEPRPILVPQNQLNKPTTVRSPPSATGQQKPVQGQQSILEMMRSPQKAQAQQPQQQVVNNNRQPNNAQNVASTSNKPNENNQQQQQPAQQGASTAKCVYLESTNGDHSRFEIVGVGYNKTLIEIFKSMKSKRYEPETKRWNFSMREYDELMLQVKLRLGNTLKIEPLDRQAVSNVKSIQARFALLDRTRFEVQAEYKAELKAIFDTIHSRRYDPNAKKYTFELKDYDELFKKIQEKFTRGEVSIIALPKAVREVFKDQFAGINKPRFDPQYNLEYLKDRIDPTIFKSILPFQVEGICFAVQQNGRLLLADDMGLGKTIQGLAIASYYKDEWPLFIVAPSSVKFMWKESCKKWLTTTIMKVCRVDNPELVDNYIQVIENGRQAIDPTCKIVISSYDLLAKNIENISKVHYKVIIADESHLLKTVKAARTKAAIKLIQNCNRVILLSGTPALSRPVELFAQINAINPQLFSTLHDFGLRYCAAKESKFGWDYTGYSNMSELRLLLEEKLLIRREKREVIQQLPTKMREKVQLDPSLIEHKSKSLVQASQRVDEPHMKASDKRSAVINYFQETCKAKFKAVCQYVADLIESDKKFIVFAHHQIMLDEIEKECQNAGAGYMRIDGSTQSETRQYLAQRFQTEEECRVAILSITAASSGLTLTAANLVVFAELFWNPGILVQAEDRVYRIGQRDSVMIQYLYAKGTADDKIWPLVNEKLNVLTKAGLTKELLSEAKNISKNEPVNNPNSIANIFKELIEMESAQNPPNRSSVENPDDENSLPGISIEEVNLLDDESNHSTTATTTTITNKKPQDAFDDAVFAPFDDEDEEDAFLMNNNQNKLDSYFSKLPSTSSSSSLNLAPPNKKIKQ